MSERGLGFIGLGNMGGRMARRIIDSGTFLLGFDPRSEAIDAAGAVPAGTAAEVVEAERKAHENRLEDKDIDELDELEDIEDESFLNQYRFVRIH